MTTQTQKCPEKYEAPLTERADIIRYLTGYDYLTGENVDTHHADVCERDSRRYDYKNWPFCFDVKLHDLDLSFDRLVERYVGSGEGKLSKSQLAKCRKVYETWDEAKCPTCGTKTNQSSIEELLQDYGVEGAARRVLEDDMQRELWDGTDLRPLEWQFMGRSGGWLVLTRFEGISLADEEDFAVDDESDPDETWNIDRLRRLYRFIVQCEADFAEPEREVEFMAAFDFFVNICREITDKE